jgi:magnesium chelatase family protein
VGNGTRPGEVSLAHRGVLYLDELLEYRREAIGVLATVLRDGESSSRIGTRILRYPAVPAALVAAANPCPCGYRYLNDPRRRCACSPERVRAYEAQLTARAELLGLVRVDVPAIRMEDLS